MKRTRSRAPTTSTASSNHCRRKATGASRIWWINGLLLALIAGGGTFLLLGEGEAESAGKATTPRRSGTHPLKVTEVVSNEPPSITYEVVEGARHAKVDAEGLKAWCAANHLPEPPRLAGAESAVVESFMEALHQAAKKPTAEDYGRLGQICESQLAHPCAQEYFRRAVEADPSDYRWHYYLGYVQQVLGRQEDAVRFLQTALRLNPSYPTTHARLGQLYLELGRGAEAERHFQRYLELAPHDWFGHVGLGRVALERKDAAAALRHLQQAERLGPNDFQVQYNLGRAYLAMGQPDLAEPHLARSRALPQGAWFLGRDPLEKELRRSAQSTDPLVKEFERLQASGDWAKLAALAEQIVQRRPDDVNMLSNLVSLLRKLGRHSEAHAALDRALALAPGSARVAAVEAELLLTESRNEESLAAADRALRLDPGQVPAQAVRGRALFLLQRFAEAEAAMRRAVELRPYDASDVFALGEVLRAQGKLEEAASLYRRALELRPDYTLAQQRLEEMK